MSEDGVLRINTKCGLLSVGDLAVATIVANGNKEINIIFVREFYKCEREQYIHLYIFCPSTGETNRTTLSWEEFEQTITKLNIICNFDNVSSWHDFIGQYQTYQLIRKAERLLTNHIAYLATP